MVVAKIVSERSAPHAFGEIGCAVVRVDEIAYDGFERARTSAWLARWSSRAWSSPFTSTGKPSLPWVIDVSVLAKYALVSLPAAEYRHYQVGKGLQIAG